MESYIPVLAKSQEKLTSLKKSVASTEVELNKDHFNLLFDEQLNRYETNLKLVNLLTLWFTRIGFVFIFSILAISFLGYVHAKSLKERP